MVNLNVSSGQINQGGSCLFAEATSCQLEFKYLAKLTDKKEYYQGVRTYESFPVVASDDTPNRLKMLWRYYIGQTLQMVFSQRDSVQKTGDPFPVSNSIRLCSVCAHTIGSEAMCSPLHSWRDI